MRGTKTARRRSVRRPTKAMKSWPSYSANTAPRINGVAGETLKNPPSVCNECASGQ